MMEKLKDEFVKMLEAQTVMYTELLGDGSGQLDLNTIQEQAEQVAMAADTIADIIAED